MRACGSVPETKYVHIENISGTVLTSALFLSVLRTREFIKYCVMVIASNLPGGFIYCDESRRALAAPGAVGGWRGAPNTSQQTLGISQNSVSRIE